MIIFERETTEKGNTIYPKFLMSSSFFINLHYIKANNYDKKSMTN